VRGYLIAAACVAAGLFHICQSGTNAARADDAVAYQINVAHSGQGSLAGFKGKLKLLWTENLGAGNISYPLIADGLVIVTVANKGSGGTQLIALNQTTGAVVWQQSISGTYPWSNAAYDSGQVFVINTDGQLSAFTSTSGKLSWSVQLTGGSYADFDAPPTASGGQVFVAGYENPMCSFTASMKQAARPSGPTR
jgi:outer membrane protein assembly factor BamB